MSSHSHRDEVCSEALIGWEGLGPGRQVWAGEEVVARAVSRVRGMCQGSGFPVLLSGTSRPPGSWGPSVCVHGQIEGQGLQVQLAPVCMNADRILRRPCVHKGTNSGSRLGLLEVLVTCFANLQ